MGGIIPGPAGSASTIPAAAWPTIVNTYTASATLPIADDVSIINGTAALTFTLPYDTVDRHVHRIKRYGSGAVTINVTVDGASTAILLQAAGPPFDSIDLEWSTALSSYLAV
jgi:hypothetical protein